MTCRQLVDQIYLRLCGSADPATMVAEVIALIDAWREGPPPPPPGPNA